MIRTLALILILEGISGPESEDDHDSGYNSELSEARAERLRLRRVAHEDALLALQNLCDKKSDAACRRARVGVVSLSYCSRAERAEF